MASYRVNTDNGYVGFPEKNQACLDYHAMFGIGEIETIQDELPMPIDYSDKHTAIYVHIWRGMGYIGAWEIIQATAVNNAYKAEAEALINWYWNTWAGIESGDMDFETILLNFADNDYVTTERIQEAINANKL